MAKQGGQTYGLGDKQGRPGKVTTSSAVVFLETGNAGSRAGGLALSANWGWLGFVDSGLQKACKAGATGRSPGSKPLRVASATTKGQKGERLPPAPAAARPTFPVLSLPDWRPSPAGWGALVSQRPDMGEYF
ncbi:hypothetical protein DHEL01_v206045 [Diaporthe helianthi]|uniref:Uncharacterized protein n=1 Tax=Diaporthe helianthi TaxID=158607 RepID=A0A2P5HZ90_DIAHE|nr:hypothetical protein DHEL01_v206045 [Diaporthe helianthi]